MARLPNSQYAILDARKIEDYCLNPGHPRGRHKARLFREALGIERTDAGWLRELLLSAVEANEATEISRDSFGIRWRVDIEVRRHQASRGKNRVDRPKRRRHAPFRHLLGALMAEPAPEENQRPALLGAVALLNDRPQEGLARGQVGTVVELLDGQTALVEFSDDDGRAYAITPCPMSELLVLHYVPEAA
jgi:hypothetical protein